MPIAVAEPQTHGQERCSASLPWYDFDQIRWATDALWAGLAARLRGFGLPGVPDRLRTDADWASVWRRPDLLLSQSCGYDAAVPYRPTLRVVATPCYRAPGCHGSSYTSVLVVREKSPVRTLADLRGSRCAINNPTSHSGLNCLRALVAPRHRNGRFFSAVYQSGCHVSSLERIQNGSIDVAAIDCVVFELIRLHRPRLLRGLRVLCITNPAPAPPFVTRANLPESEFVLLRQALREVVADPALADVREALLLERVEFLAPAAYQPMVELGRRALAHGYLEMESPLPMAAGY